MKWSFKTKELKILQSRRVHIKPAYCAYNIFVFSVVFFTWHAKWYDADHTLRRCLRQKIQMIRCTRFEKQLTHNLFSSIFNYVYLCYYEKKNPRPKFFHINFFLFMWFTTCKIYFFEFVIVTTIKDNNIFCVRKSLYIVFKYYLSSQM